jgi:dihydroxyacetone kinase-like protein
MHDTTTARPGPAGTAAFAEFTRQWVRDFAATAAATEAELTALDQRVGDGDFGTNLLAGCQAALRLLTTAPGGLAARPEPDGAAPAPAPGPGPGPGPVSVAAPPTDAAAPLDAAAAAFLDEVGGTSGPLFGLLFQELATALRDGQPGGPTAAVAAGVRGGLAAIQRVGEAEEGDKTLVDALAPAARALAAASPHPASEGSAGPGGTGGPDGAEPARALAAAARAAWQGVHDTARITARRGRASYLGDRAAGVPDPGAVGVALLFTSAAGPVTALAPLLP